jgi:hypothetical protein
MQITSVRQTEAAGVETASRNRSVPLTGTGPSGVRGHRQVQPPHGHVMAMASHRAAPPHNTTHPGSRPVARNDRRPAATPAVHQLPDRTLRRPCRPTEAHALRVVHDAFGWGLCCSVAPGSVSVGHITSVSDGHPPTTASSPPRGPGAAAPTVSPITAFLLHARRQAADGAVDPIPGAPPAGVPRLPPLADSAEDDGAPDGVSQLPPSAISVADDGAVAAPPVAATRKRKGRGKRNCVARDERKRQRWAALLPTPQDNTEAGT